MNPDAAELDRRARALLRPEVYDYYAGGSGREATLRANEKAWRRVWLRPRIFRDVSAVDTGVDLIGGGGRVRRRMSTPVAVAPTAFHGLAHPDGELATAAGAARAGSLYVLSTRSSRRIEEVAAVLASTEGPSGAGGTWWFQVYLMRDRELTAGLVRRAVTAGAQALVLTADTPVVGRKGRSKGRSQGDDMVTEADFLVNLGPLADLSSAEQASDVTFADIGWLADVSGGLPVVVKGVLRPDDAVACMAHGAAGVIVSNHGGRQLDGAVPTACALPEVAASMIGSPMTELTAGSVYVDGGVRSAEDALAALALGARLVFLGRPVLWALACGGSDGVQALLDGFTDDLAHTMALAGAACLSDLADLTLPGPQADPGAAGQSRAAGPGAFAGYAPRTYVGVVRAILPARRDRAHLVTEAQRPMSEDIAYRQRRYLIMMGIRVVCFGAAVALFAAGAGWLTAIPAVGAIIIPYFAVVFANGGREPTSTRGFRAYEPRVPARRIPREQGPGQGTSGPADAVADAGPFTGSNQDPGAFTGSNQKPKGDQETAG